jgi:hypothetical protein
VAYHYRGHFIYAYPAGNPIEPVPFSTKKGINIVGLMQDRAPIFNSKAPHLVPESEIAALQRACIHEKEFQKEQEDASKEGTQKALAEEARPVPKKRSKPLRLSRQPRKSLCLPVSHPLVSHRSRHYWYPRECLRDLAHKSLSNTSQHPITGPRHPSAASRESAPSKHQTSPPPALSRHLRALAQATLLTIAATTSPTPLPVRVMAPSTIRRLSRAQYHQPMVSVSAALAMATTLSSDPLLAHRG